MLQLLSRVFHFWVLGYIAACLTSSKIAQLGHQTLPALCRAAGVLSRAFLPWGQPLEHRGQELCGLALGVSDGLVAFVIPPTAS